MSDGSGGRRLGRGLKALISVPDEVPSGGDLLRIPISRVRRATEYAPWHPGRCAEFVVPTDQSIGYAGELHPEVCASFGLPARTAAAEIDLDALVSAAPAIGDIPVISGFPVAKEDVALIVDDEVPAAEVERALRAGAGPQLESIWLFDI